MPRPPEAWFWLGPLPLPEAWLNNAERRSSQRLRNPHARQLAINAHLLKRYALSQRVPERPPAQWQFATSPLGKPEVGDAACHFNVSHADRACAVAVSDAPIGIDIERQRQLADLDTLATRVLTRAEYDWLQNQPHRSHQLIRLWTLKEAALKAAGQGLRMDPKAVRIRAPHADVSQVQLPDGSCWMCQSRQLSGYWLTTASSHFDEVRLRTGGIPGHG
ncbi:4'-phosphopantetheinyl transferase family protein [Marinobacter sp. SS21]|uniref:4'-phosphopantetheinyl transferase family protein n=1 Tax=Marinobacter sp. SS21 TaxID=2979460 RepID=UPI00232AB0DB|nr:4'-phosphopantetheinyl transferase superfamily protein [Marinobacter sp. SS21]MDC0662357.1 4'-phosphopantetheinyl transferase superfamily protein [Marinobacter sp. SS21]